jgi:hypothetical protein
MQGRKIFFLLLGANLFADAFLLSKKSDSDKNSSVMASMGKYLRFKKQQGRKLRIPAPLFSLEKNEDCGRCVTFLSILDGYRQN